MKTLNDLLIEARAVDKSPLLARQLRDLTIEQGPILQLMCAFLEMRDGYTESAVAQDLVTDESRAMAIKLRGQVVGIDSCLAAIYSLMTEDQANKEEDES